MRPTAGQPFWPGIDLDLTGAHLVDWTMTGSHVHLANFTRATFTGDALFGGATFHGAARFGGTTFHGDAGFGEATFQGDAQFGDATFHGAAIFGEATFTGDAIFGEATLHGAAQFGEATLHGAAMSPRVHTHRRSDHDSPFLLSRSGQYCCARAAPDQRRKTQ